MSFSSSSDSSEDEEKACWRAELRRQVEEDIERQVRLRLGLRLTQSNETTEYPDIHWSSSYNTNHSCLQLTPRYQNPSTTHSENAVLHTGEGEEDVSGVNGKRGDRVEKRRSSRLPSITLDLGGKARLFQYLSKHHGPPIRQLQELSCSGSYKTYSRREGGLSDDIHWPEEAIISFPTPHHIMTPPPQPPAQLTPSLAAQATHRQLGQEGDSEDSGREGEAEECGEEQGMGRDRVVYVCGKGGEEEGEGDCLVFDSRFESGNLYEARQSGPHDYTLVLNPDLYSRRHVQWYYFRVTNMKTTPTYTFHIVNFEKTDSLYNHGMQPLLYSEAEAKSTGIGWTRVGWNVAYHWSRFHYPPHMSPDHSYYTLSWCMKFHHHGDTCYLAHCYPYPLSALHRLLGYIEQDKERAKYVQREELCQTLAGNICPVLTITEPREGEGGEGEEEGERGRKRGVVVTARVHPGETNSSWIMEGLVYFLTSDSPHAHALRRCFVFKLVPMLNPDGVVVGNYRTSLAGVDLNRVYKTPDKTIFPTVYYTKKMMAQFRQERELCVYVDLHGHSRKQNVFMYGCHKPKADHTHFLYERMLPFLLSQQAPTKFSFASCKFAVQRCKEATGRVVTWRSGVPNSFTLEATFCGSNLGSNRWQFSESDLCDMGRDLGEALYKFSKCIRSKTYQLKVMACLADIYIKDKQATPPGHTPSTLPDVVTSTTSSIHQHSLRSDKKQAQHTLRRFMKLDIHQLQQESSTSGSDSENEDFEFRRKKLQHRSRRQRHSLVSQTQSHLSPHLHHPPSHHPSSHHLPPSLQHPSTNTSYRSPELTLPSLITQATPPNQWNRASAPARLQSSLHTLVGTGSKWKFVNRYANRSNGGIPMFAEERLKERVERKRLTSLSEVVHLPPTSNVTTGHTHSINMDHRPHPLWTHSPDSIPEFKKPPHLFSHASPRQQHYQQIKDLVEHLYMSPDNHVLNTPPRAHHQLPVSPRAHLPTHHPSPRAHLPTHHPSPRAHLPTHHPSPRAHFPTHHPSPGAHLPTHHPSPGAHLPTQHPSPRAHLPTHHPSPGAHLPTQHPSPRAHLPTHHPSPGAHLPTQHPSPRAHLPTHLISYISEVWNK